MKKLLISLIIFTLSLFIYFRSKIENRDWQLTPTLQSLHLKKSSNHLEVKNQLPSTDLIKIQEKSTTPADTNTSRDESYQGIDQETETLLNTYRDQYYKLGVLFDTFPESQKIQFVKNIEAEIEMLEDQKKYFEKQNNIPKVVFIEMRLEYTREQRDYFKERLK